MENVIYNVIVDGSHFRCMDTSNGMQLGLSGINGTVISGPIVSGDRMTVILKDNLGNQKGYVMKLPSFNTITTFSA
jgi:hypothetical protein